jgi:hypothetical protein
MLPFTQEQFLDIFSQYHAMTWPFVYVVHLVAILLIVHLIWSNKPLMDANLVLSFLGVLWVWMGIVYHWIHFATINPAAKFFSVGFVIQGICLLVESARSNRIDLGATPRRTQIATGVLIVYALVIYPLLGLWMGHVYPAAPIFGLPCPTTIFTFGMLLLLHNDDGRPLRRLYILPALWSIVATYAAISMSIVQDWALPVAAIVTIMLMRAQPRRSPIQLRFQIRSMR